MRKGKTVLFYRCERKEIQFLYEINPELRIFEFWSQEDVIDRIPGERVDAVFISLRTEPCEKESYNAYLVRRIRRIHGWEVTPVIFLLSEKQIERPEGFNDISFCAFLRGSMVKEENRKLLTALLGEDAAEGKKIKLVNSSRYFHFNQEDFVYVESVSRTLIIHTRRGEIAFPYLPLKEFLEKVDFHQVYQCHRSIAVNRHYILGIDLSKRIIFLEEPFGTLEIGRNFKETFVDTYFSPKER